MLLELCERKVSHQRQPAFKIDAVVAVGRHLYSSIFSQTNKRRRDCTLDRYEMDLDHSVYCTVAD
jgi:hypothetical protein